MKFSILLRSLFTRSYHKCVGLPSRRRRMMIRPPQAEFLEPRLLLTSDFGDAPFPYPTTSSDGGAEHIIGSGLTLGVTVDSEADGFPSGNADADGADENGVIFETMAAGQLGATVTVVTQGGPGKLDAWIDFNGDGSWGGPGEQIPSAYDLGNGAHELHFDVPSSAESGTTYARFRLSSAGELGTGGAAADGEVEDYLVTIDAPTNASGAFSGANTIGSSVIGRNELHTADVDGDGDIDVLTVQFFTDSISWFENDGSENFTAHTVSNLPNGPTDVTVADIDGDGDMDVIGSSSFDDTIAWYENDGNEVFSRHVISNNADGAAAVFTVDMDGDGDIDVLSANSNLLPTNSSFAWYENDGAENFTAKSINASRGFASDVFAADINGDGHMDVVGASSFDDTIAWYQNDGSQAFSEIILSTRSDGAESVFAADVDADGDVDVVAASRFDNTIAWYENNGLPLLKRHVISNTTIGSENVSVADINGDGLPDIVAASSTGDTLVWFDGAQSFAEQVIASSPSGAKGLSIADIDGSGSLDVLSTDVSGAISWHNNFSILDFADAPAPYATTLADNGPRHTWSSDLKLGAQTDGEVDGQPLLDAKGDDLNDFSDEDGVLSPLDLTATIGTSPSVTLLVSNTTGVQATLAGWIDYNADGVFDNATERATVNVPVATVNDRVTLTFPPIPVGSAGATYARFRLSSEAGFVSNPEPTGSAADGEVEDYGFSITNLSDGGVVGQLKIADGLNGLPAGTLEQIVGGTGDDEFGSAVAALGDVDGDGIGDLAVGAWLDENTGSTEGAVYILMLNADGTVKSHQKITDGLGGLPTGTLDDDDVFGVSVAALDDIDHDGVPDLAVGAQGDDIIGFNEGAVYIFSLNTDGTVKSHQKISDGIGGLPSGTLGNSDRFGSSVSSLGDLDGDGVTDIAVGAAFSGNAVTGVSSEGAVYTLMLNADGTVRTHNKINNGNGGLSATAINGSERFGYSVAAIGDVDGDGVLDLAVGAENDSTSGTNTGAVHILTMHPDGTVKGHQKVADGIGGLLSGTIGPNERFGASVAPLGDLDGNGVPDLAVGALNAEPNGGSTSQGAIFILMLNADGTVLSQKKISDGLNGLAAGALQSFDHFGAGLGNLGDINGDGVVDLVIGAVGVDNDKGGAWILNLDSQQPEVVDNLNLLTATDRVPGNVVALEQGPGMALVPDNNDNAVHVFTDANGDIVVQGLAGTTVNGLSRDVLFPGSHSVAGTFRVFASADTMLTSISGLTIGGGIEVFGGAASEALELTNVDIAGHMTVNLTDGDNSLVFRDSSGAAAKTLVQTGAGNDDVELDNATFGTINDIQTGAGNDTIQSTQSSYGGSLAILTDAGNDSVQFDGDSVDTDLRVTTGDGNDDIDLSQVSVTLKGIAEPGRDTDTLMVSGGSIGAPFIANLDSGTNTMNLNSTFLSSINVNGQNNGTHNVGLTGGSIAGATSINTFSGTSDVDIDGVTASLIFLIATDASDDTIDISNSTFVDTLNISTNAGTDHVTVSDSRIDNSFLVTTSVGADTISLTDVNVLVDLFLDAGVDVDTVTLDQTTVSLVTGIVTGGGADTLSIDDSQLGTITNINSGAQSDTLDVLETSFAGNVTVSTEGGLDLINAAIVDVTGALTIDSGPDNDVIDLDLFVTNQLISVQPGSGDDAVRLANSTTSASTNIAPTSGNNVIDLDGNHFQDHVTVATIAAQLAVRVRGNSFTTASFIASASGANDVLLDNSTNSYDSAPAIINFDDFSNSLVDELFEDLLGLVFS